MYKRMAELLKRLSTPALLGLGLVGLPLVTLVATSTRSHLVIRLLGLLAAPMLAGLVLAAERVVVDMWGERATGTTRRSALAGRPASARFSRVILSDSAPPLSRSATRASTRP